MEDRESLSLLKNLTIENALESISRIEESQSLSNPNNLVKWKNYAHQVLVESDSYFYKIYEVTSVEAGPFQSIVRHALARVYQDIGIDWKVISFERDGKILDFEQREKLKEATPDDGDFSRVFLSFSHILDKVEKILEFDSILSQLKSNPAYSSVDHIKLLRNCVNKHQDYALFGDQFVLLDDADFYITLSDDKGDVVRIDANVNASVKTSYGDFIFTQAEKTSIKDGHPLLKGSPVSELYNCWYLFKEKKQSDFDGNELKDEPTELHEELLRSDLADGHVFQHNEELIKHAIEINERQLGCNSTDGRRKSGREKGKMQMMEIPEHLTEEDKLYHNNFGRMSFQWELWECCNNLCKFCYLGTDNRHTDKERQLKSLSDLKKNLDNLDFSVYNNISLIGGEFFQGQLNDPEIKESFMEMIHKVADLYVNKKIGSVWITATLTIGDQADLYETLDVFERAGALPLPEYGASGLWICTSWDAQGRFHTEQARENWEFHMQNMRNYYPWVKKNTTIILSQKFCEMYLANEFSPHDFMERFDTSLFYKQPGLYEINGKGDGTYGDLLDLAEEGQADLYMTRTKARVEEDLGFRFYPDRKTFRKFLIKYAKEDPDTFERLFNIMFRADELHRNFNNVYEDDGHQRNKNSNKESNADTDSIFNRHCLLEPLEAKHIISYATYVDCNDCMICDRNQIWEAVQAGRL